MQVLKEAAQGLAFGFVIGATFAVIWGSGYLIGINQCLGG